MKKNLFSVFTLSVCILSACASSIDLQADVFSIGDSLKTPNELIDILPNDDINIIDVRTPDEFASGCVQNAKNIDVKSSDFLSKISTLDKEEFYLVYCRSGVRSAQAAEQMRKAGFTNIIELQGGISNWEESGYGLSYSCLSVRDF